MKLLPRRSYEQLPGQAGDRRCVGQPQPQPQPVAVVAGVVLRPLPGQHDVLGEHTLEQRPTQIHRRLAELAAVSRVQASKQNLQFGPAEWQRELRGGTLPEWTGRHPRAETPIVRRLEQEVEVLVGPQRHGWLFRWVSHQAGVVRRALMIPAAWQSGRDRAAPATPLAKALSAMGSPGRPSEHSDDEEYERRSGPRASLTRVMRVLTQADRRTCVTAKRRRRRHVR